MNLLWLVCLFVLFDQIHLQNFLPGSNAVISSQKAENLRLPADANPLAIAALSDDTVGLADPAADSEIVDAGEAVERESAARFEPQSVLPSDSEPSSPVPASRRRVSREEICDTVVSAAQANNLPVGFLIRLIWQESGFDSGVVSSAGAQGMAQFMPKVAAEWGVSDPFDPLQALPASARLLRALHQQFGNLGLAAAAYNAGSGRIQNWLTKRGKLPDETRSYVMNITGHPAEKWVKAAPHGISFRVPNRAPCREIAMQLDASVVPLPLPRLGPPSVTASRALDVKPLAVSHVASREPLPKIAAPASIMAERADGKMRVAKVTTSGKRQQLVLSMKDAAKSPARPARASVQVAAVTKPAKKPASKSTKTASKGPLQLAMVMRSSKK